MLTCLKRRNTNAFSLLRQKEEFKRQGILCSDPECIYAELLTQEESKAGLLEEKVEELKGKLKESLEELTSLKQAHENFVSEVEGIAFTRRHLKKALQVFTR